MTYLEATRYLESFVNYEQKNSYPYKKSFKLERVRGFLKLLGNPQGRLRSLHVCGTKGKGSVCAYLAYILKEARFRVGLYTSPHLVDFRERIRVLEKKRQSANFSFKFEGMISKGELARQVGQLRPLVERYKQLSKYGGLTFFEICTVLAFLYFRQKKLDYAVLETGLGGRLDATSTVYPLVCGITPISFDHTDKLGKSLKSIAREKAGIIKSQKSKVKSQKLVVVSAKQDPEAAGVIRERCRKMRARLYELGRDISWRRPKQNSLGQTFDLQGINRIYRNLKTRLIGEHQLDNAALAVAMIEALKDKRIRPFHIRAGLKNTLWPGRLELAAKTPDILLDGAQNLASAKALKKSILSCFSYQQLFLILGISEDKDIKGVCSELYPLADKVILTTADNPRACLPKELTKYFIGKDTQITLAVPEALRLAKQQASKEDLILVTGSLFVVGEALRELKND